MRFLRRFLSALREVTLWVVILVAAGIAGAATGILITYICVITGIGL